MTDLKQKLEAIRNRLEETKPNIIASNAAYRTDLPALLSALEIAVEALNFYANGNAGTIEDVLIGRTASGEIAKQALAEFHAALEEKNEKT